MCLFGVLTALALAACDVFSLRVEELPASRASASTPLVRLAVAHAAEPLAQALVAAYRSYRPGVAILSPTMSDAAALQALSDGEADLALVAVASDEEPEPGAAGLRFLPVARDAVAIIANEGLGLAQLTTEELQRLFAGEIGDWSELGCRAATPAIAVQAPGSPAREALDRVAMQGSQLTSTARVLSGDDDLIAYVRSESNAIGYACASHLSGSEGVGVVALDRLLPTRENVEQGTYPLSVGLYLVVAPGQNEHAAAFEAFVSGARGRQAVRGCCAAP